MHCMYVYIYDNVCMYVYIYSMIMYVCTYVFNMPEIFSGQNTV